MLEVKYKKNGKTETVKTTGFSEYESGNAVLDNGMVVHGVFAVHFA